MAPDEHRRQRPLVQDLGDRIPQLAEVLEDGAWLARWPRVRRTAMPALLVIGFVSAIAWPGVDFLYSESLGFLLLVAVVSWSSASLGLVLLVGYVLGHVLGVPGPSPRTDFTDHDLGWFLARTGGRVVVYGLLALITVKMPLLARRWADELADGAFSGTSATVTRWVRTLAWSSAAGLLTFLWSQALVVLLRPAFTWIGHAPTTDAVVHVQEQSEWLVAAAVMAVLVRAGLQYGPWAPTTGPHAGTARPASPLRPRQPMQLSPRARIALGAIAVTMLLGGVYDSWIDALVTLATVGVIAAIRVGSWRPLPSSWARSVVRVPAVVRFLLAIGFSLALANLFIGDVESSFRPMLLSALSTIVVLAMAFPAEPGPLVTEDEPRTAGQAARTVLLLTGAFIVLGGPEIALADNCSTPTDCWGVAGAAAAAAAGAGAAAAAGVGRDGGVADGGVADGVVADGGDPPAATAEGSTVWEDTDGDGVDDLMTEFDADGNKISEQRFDADGNKVSERRFDAEGNTTSFQQFNEDGSSVTYEDQNADGTADRITERDPDGNITRQQVHDKDGTGGAIYEDFDADGTADRATRVDEHGRRTQEWHFDEDGGGRLLEDIDGDGTADRITDVDEDGNIVRQQATDDDGGGGGTIYEDTDRDGDIDRITEVDEDGEVVSERSLEDDDGEA